MQTAALKQDIVVEANGIRNLRPHPGEPAYLEDRIVSGKVSEGEMYVLIRRIPGISGVGELLIISGNASPDTLAGAEWLTPALARPPTGAVAAHALGWTTGVFPGGHQGGV